MFLGELVNQHILYKLYDQSSVPHFHFQPDKGAAVPRFGEWDENNPSSAENFTQKFNKVRQEKNSNTPVVSSTSRGQAGEAYANRRKQNDYNRNKVRLHSRFISKKHDFSPLQLCMVSNANMFAKNFFPPVLLEQLFSMLWKVRLRSKDLKYVL